MKIRFASLLIVALFVSTLAVAGDASLTGYVVDSKCGAKAAHEGAAECTAKCVKEGAKLVFVNDADKKVYAITDQDKVAAHAGHHVSVKGSLEGDTLTVASIDMAPTKGK
jgi:SpoU rRNA methylase family enzyme